MVVLSYFKETDGGSMFEISSSKYFSNSSEHVIIFNDSEYLFSFNFDLEETYSNHFNPGSFYGHYERYSGMQPIDVVFSEVGFFKNDVYEKLENPEIVFKEEFVQIISKIENEIVENYDYD